MKAIRRNLTKPLHRLGKAALPRLSDTEREVLKAERHGPRFAPDEGWARFA